MSLFGNTIGFVQDHLVRKTGAVMEGPINMNGQALSGLKEPTSDNDAATKKYADDIKEYAHTEVNSAKTGANEYTDERITKRLVHRNGSKNLFNPREATGSNSNVKFGILRHLDPSRAGDYPESYGLVIESLTAGTNHCAQAPARLKAGVTYTMSAELTDYGYGYVRFAFRDSNTKSILKTTPRLEATGKYSVSYTPENDIDVNFAFFVTGSTSQIGKVQFDNIMVEEGNVATDYEPYYYSVEQLTDLVDTLLGVSE